MVNDSDWMDQPYSLQPHLEAIERCFGKSSVEAIFTALEEERTPWVCLFIGVSVRERERIEREERGELFFFPLGCTDIDPVAEEVSSESQGHLARPATQCQVAPGGGSEERLQVVLSVRSCVPPPSPPPFPFQQRERERERERENDQSGSCLDVKC